MNAETRVLELFGVCTRTPKSVDWAKLVRRQLCPYTAKRCFKVRKSRSRVSIGTCAVRYSKMDKDVIICPARLLERKQVFMDCVHLLALHEPGNELHVLPEVRIPGGNVDYFLVSVFDDRVVDFVAIEFQTLDTTQTVWPDRQEFLHQQGVKVPARDLDTGKSFGMNWKMTAKTALMQLHHKARTFEGVNKHLASVIQDHYFDYMRGEFDFGRVRAARAGDPVHFHVYQFNESPGRFALQLEDRFSTDVAGVAQCLDLRAEARVELDVIVQALERKLARTPDSLLALEMSD